MKNNAEIEFLKSQNEAVKKQNESLQGDYNDLKGRYNTLEISFHTALAHSGRQAKKIQTLTSALEKIADGGGNTCYAVIAREALKDVKDV